MKRFYETALAGYHAKGFCVWLDQKMVRTPQQQTLDLPNLILAKKIAAEFRDQKETIVPAQMPITSWAFSVEDRIAPRLKEVKEEILSYAAGDAICYWAGQPENLRAKEKQIWGGLLARLETEGLKFNICLGVTRADQPSDSIQKLANAMQKMDPWHLGLWLFATNLTGSALASYIWLRGGLTVDEFFAAGFLPEIFRCELAGDDPKQAPHLAPKWQSIQELDWIKHSLDHKTKFAEVHLWIYGRVQGVGFRAWTVKMAEKQGFSGFVRNRKDGPVEAVLVGPMADLNQAIKQCLRGPILASVDRLTITGYKELAAMPTAGFEQKPTE
ncbi:MAG: hypothetical protein EYC62_07920 [Alphaproteobacteria bacterium]|nr:MAG: hypothetical protein EYC62_07920 [Alphaproteobacteria bacterium]